MYRRVTPASRLARSVVLAGLLGVACAAIPARAQAPGQGPPDAPKFALTVVVTEGDEKMGKAIEDAKAYFASLAKDDAKDKAKQEQDNTTQGRPPAFPASGDAAQAGGPATTELIAAAAALPPLGLAEKLVAEQLTAAKGAAARFRWVLLKDENAQIRLGLHPSAANSKTRKEYFEKAAEARKKNEVYVHGLVKWATYSRESPRGVEYFVLAYQPEAKALVTGEVIETISPEAPGVLVRLTPGGEDRLKAFTTEYQTKDMKRRYALATFGEAAEEVVQISEPIENGQLRLGVERTRAGADALARLLTNARR